MSRTLRLSIDGLPPVVLSPEVVGAGDTEAEHGARAHEPDPLTAHSEVRPIMASLDDRASGVSRFEVTVEGWAFIVEAEPDARAALRERSAAGRVGLVSDGPAVVRAPMPGRIVRSWVAVGDTVEAGQRLLSVEAMKMENEVRAPRSGEVAHIAVAVGSSVELGDELIIVR